MQDERVCEIEVSQRSHSTATVHHDLAVFSAKLFELNLLLRTQAEVSATETVFKVFIFRHIIYDTNDVSTMLFAIV